MSSASGWQRGVVGRRAEESLEPASMQMVGESGTVGTGAETE